MDDDGEEGGEGGDEDVGEDDDGPITNAATFSFSSLLSSSEDSHDDSMSVSQSPTMYAFPPFFFLLELFVLFNK